MLSAVVCVILGVALAIVLSYRRNRRELAQGGAGYQPPTGLIRWSEAERGKDPGQA